MESRRQATVVALYGPKPDAFAALIQRCQKAISENIGRNFRAFPLEQIHATIVGMERDLDPESDVSCSTGPGHAPRQQSIGAWIEALRELTLEPFHVRFGGFQPEEQPFLSRGQSPHERSFQLSGSDAILVGWPVRRRAADAASMVATDQLSFPDTLDRLRSAAEAFGIFHRYKQGEWPYDNDLYLRIGTLNRQLFPQQMLAGCQMTLQRLLASVSPVHVRITAASLAVVGYTNRELPIEDTYTMPIMDSEAGERIEQWLSR